MPRSSEKRSYRRWSERRLHLVSGHFAAFVTVNEAAELAHVRRKTVITWLDGRHQMPPAVRELLEFKALGLLWDERWRGFAVRRGRLVTPWGQAFTPTELAAWGDVYARSRTFWREIERLRAEVERLKTKTRSRA